METQEKLADESQSEEIKTPEKTDTIKSLKKKLGETNKRVDKLEFIVRKMSHFSGNNRILIEAGVDVWEPGKNDMKKYKD